MDEENVTQTEGTPTEVQESTETPAASNDTNPSTGETEEGAEATPSEEEVNEEGKDEDTPTDEEGETATLEGIDIEGIEKEFLENNGEVSEETLEGLYKVFPKDLVDRYFENAQVAYTAQVEKARSEAFKITEGEENYTKMVEWASQNLEPEIIEAFNNSLKGDLAQASLAIRGMYLQYQEANKGEPMLIQGGQGSLSDNLGVFSSRAEHIAAVNDPRYEKDAGYRQEVAKRLQATIKSGGFKR